MLKLARRTAMAERQAARRAARKQAVEDKSAKWTRIHQEARIARDLRGERAAARVARREDWEQGPLAPRRNSAAGDGRSSAQGLYYGSIGPERLKPESRLRDFEAEARCAWAGGTKHLCLAVGDRAVVLEGPEKGRIGTVKEVNAEKGWAVLNNVGVYEQKHNTNGSSPPPSRQANIHLPEFIMPSAEEPVQPMEYAIPISSLRLVHPIPDPKTGALRDAIIRELVPHNITFDRQSRYVGWQRLVPGLNIQIPWPKREAQTYTDHKCDTLRVDVERKTYVPTLLKPPVPAAVIDELRNRYSKFRTRHEPEYVARKEAEAEAAAARAALASTMRTPLQEFHAETKRVRLARGQPALSDEMLERIGQVIARNKERTLAAVGASEVAPPANSAPES